jgi:hypothetical protein
VKVRWLLFFFGNKLLQGVVLSRFAQLIHAHAQPAVAQICIIICKQDVYRYMYLLLTLISQLTITPPKLATSQWLASSHRVHFFLMGKMNGSISGRLGL